MKLKVHRVRFVEYVPQAINCLAFEDTRGKNRLAVSRYVCLQDPSRGSLVRTMYFVTWFGESESY